MPEGVNKMIKALSCHATIAILTVFSLTFLVQPLARASEKKGASHVPTALQGPWFAGKSCASSGTYEFLGRNWIIKINPEITTENGRKEFPFLGEVFKELNSKNKNSVSYEQNLLKRVNGKIRIEKGMSIFKAKGSNHAEREFVFPANAPRTKFFWVRCEKSGISSKFWEGQSVYIKNITQALTLVNNIDDGCQAGATSCEKALFDAIDIDENNEISAAEIITFLRRVSILFLFGDIRLNGQSISYVDPQNFVYAKFGAFLAGPTIAGYIMSNVDYNDNGKIEPEELLLFMKSLGLPISDHLATVMLQQAIRDGSQIMLSLRSFRNSSGTLPGFAK